MAQKIDDTELVTLKELLMANSIQVSVGVKNYSFNGRIFIIRKKGIWSNRKPGIVS